MCFEVTFLHFDPCICIWESHFCIHKSKMTQNHAFFGHVFAKTTQIFELKSNVFVQKTQKIAFSTHTFDQKGLFLSSKYIILFLETIFFDTFMSNPTIECPFHASAEKVKRLFENPDLKKNWS